MTIEMREARGAHTIMLHYHIVMGGGTTLEVSKVLLCSRLFVQFANRTVVATSPETPSQFPGHR